jgi:hypothetical protein
MIRYLFSNIRIFCRLKMTNVNDPADATAIKIGQLYIDINKKMKTEFTNELDRIKNSKKNKKFEVYILLAISISCLKSMFWFVLELQELEDALQQARETVKNAEEAKKNAEKKVIEKKNELKRKYGST